MNSQAATVYNSKALRVAERFEQDIRSGQYREGLLLPSEGDLAQNYGVSRMTMRKVLAILADRHEVVKVPQKGAMIPPRNGQDEPDQPSAATVGPQTQTAIGAVFAAEPDAHLVGIREGIKRYAAEHGLHFQMFLNTHGHEQALHVLRHVEDYPVQGLLVLPYAHGAYLDALRRLSDAGFPIVCLDRVVGELPISSVQVDNAAGVYQATSYLIEKYHRPAYYLCTAIEHKTHRDRYQGYGRAMVDAGFGELVERYTFNSQVSDGDPDFWPNDRKLAPVAEVAERLLAENPPPLSVFCLNDYLAAGLYKAAEQRGLRVGTDLNVVGFDDIPLAKFLKPALTTTRQPRQQIGYDAAKLLHQLVCRNITPPVHIHLPVELVVRESA